MAEPIEPTTLELREGGVYFATAASPLVEGTCGLYVRTEQRPKDDSPTALFLVTRQRVVFERSTPVELVADEWTEAYTPPHDDTPIGSAWKLEVLRAERERDDALDELADVRGQLLAALEAQQPATVDPELQAERDALAAAMKEAVRLFPDKRKHLQDVYRSAKGTTS